MTRALGMHAEHSSFFWVPIPISPHGKLVRCGMGSLPDASLAAGGLPVLVTGVLPQGAQHRTGPGTGTPVTISLPRTGCSQDLACRGHPWK